MSRTHVEWDWFGDYPVFIFMNWVTHNEWKVKIVLGEKGNQNASGYSYTSPSFLEYISYKNSKHDVFMEAMSICNSRFQASIC